MFADDTASTSPPLAIFDGHNDVVGAYLHAEPLWSLEGRDIETKLEGQSDLPRWRAGGFGGSMITVTSLVEASGEAHTPTLRQSYDWFDALVAATPALARVGTAAEARAAIAKGRFAVAMAIEGGDQIDGSLERLDEAYARGVRMMTIVYDHHNDIGDGAMAFVGSAAVAAAPHGGLSAFGRDVVARMNDRGMMIDVSHAAAITALDAMHLSRAPVVFSHSGARALADTPRNVPDDVLQALRDNGGIVMISFVPYLTTAANWIWFDGGEREYARLVALHGEDRASIDAGIAAWEAVNPQPPVTVANVADQVDYVAAIVGRDHVGIGSDFGGMGSFVIPALKDAASAPALFAELRKRGWSEDELAGLAGENFLNVWARVEAAAIH